MKRLVVALALALPLAVGACASKPELRVMGLDHGSVLDRTMALQESVYAIAGQSAGPDEAAMRLDRYCDEHKDELAQLRLDAGQLTPDEQTAFAKALVERTQKLVERVKDAIGENGMLKLVDPIVLKSMGACRGEVPEEAPSPVDDGPSDGLPE
ncbi:MAG: hypothetical protein U1F43_16415 [Myxococcota bacterium]